MGVYILFVWCFVRQKDPICAPSHMPQQQHPSESMVCLVLCKQERSLQLQLPVKCLQPYLFRWKRHILLELNICKLAGNLLLLSAHLRYVKKSFIHYYSHTKFYLPTILSMRLTHVKPVAQHHCTCYSRLRSERYVIAITLTRVAQASTHL